MVLLKLLITALFIALMFVLIAAAKAGRKLGRAMAEQEYIYEMLTPLYNHKRVTNTAFWLALVAVVMTETFVRLRGGVEANALFWIHLCLAIPFLVTLAILRFWLTGLKKPTTHRKLGYLCMFLFGGTLITGLTLLWTI